MSKEAFNCGSSYKSHFVADEARRYGSKAIRSKASRGLLNGTKCPPIETDKLVKGATLYRTHDAWMNRPVGSYLMTTKRKPVPI
ncbi:hypothetical protein GGD63_007262 [Bradyrhizobium sp. cir1]|nr:hypothetical protein [Bradyrhizobium sp. cir1]